MTTQADGVQPFPFPAPVNPDRRIFEAAVRRPAEFTDAQHRFLWNSYERALRRAQGWAVG
jgi:hypothetical protein